MKDLKIDKAVAIGDSDQSKKQGKLTIRCNLNFRNWICFISEISSTRKSASFQVGLSSKASRNVLNEANKKGVAAGDHNYIHVQEHSELDKFMNLLGMQDR